MRWHLLFAVPFLLCSISGAKPFPIEGNAADSLRQFYEARHGALAWSGDPKAALHARQALAVLSRAAGDGLDAERYRVFVAGDD